MPVSRTNWGTLTLWGGSILATMLSFSSAEYVVNFVASFKSPGTRAAPVGGPLSSRPSGSFPADPQRPLGPGESDAPSSHKTSPGGGDFLS